MNHWKARLAGIAHFRLAATEGNKLRKSARGDVGIYIVIPSRSRG